MNIDLAIIILNINGQFPQSKDAKWPNGSENRNHLFADYKMLTSNSRKATILE